MEIDSTVGLNRGEAANDASDSDGSEITVGSDRVVMADGRLLCCGGRVIVPQKRPRDEAFEEIEGQLQALAYTPTVSGRVSALDDMLAGLQGNVFEVSPDAGNQAAGPAAGDLQA